MSKQLTNEELAEKYFKELKPKFEILTHTALLTYGVAVIEVSPEGEVKDITHEIYKVD